MRYLHLITTGGTIEKRYNEQMGTMANADPQIRRCLGMLRLGEIDITLTELMNKDSLLMTDDDRALIAAKVAEHLSATTPVIVTHGTDTMVETGLSIAEWITRPLAPVILTGAMTPFGIEGSDAIQNLTESLLASALLPPAVYIVFHGEVHPIRNVRKDHASSRFCAIDASVR